MKIRIKFRKYGALKFVGHLDMMRYFQKGTKTCRHRHEVFRRL